jgi:hypothetical protein
LKRAGLNLDRQENIYLSSRTHQLKESAGSVKYLFTGQQRVGVALKAIHEVCCGVFAHHAP